jgi:hypothetical protein
MVWAAPGVGAFLVLLALWLLVSAFNASGGTIVEGVGAAGFSVGIGAYLNLITAGVVAAGGFLKAREEKLI